MKHGILTGYILKMCTSYFQQIFYTRLETRGPKGLKMVFFQCFHVITFVSVDIFPWNFNTIILAIRQSLGLKMGVVSLLVWKLEAQTNSLKVLKIISFAIISQKLNIIHVMGFSALRY